MTEDVGAFWARRAGLDGTSALVLGGAGGLGRAVTLDLARAGARVLVVDRDDASLVEIERSAVREGRTLAGTVSADVRDGASLRAVLDAVEAPLGVLVNVVGGTFRQPFPESTPSGRAALVAANFTWVADAIALAIPLLRRSPRGASIINITTVEAHRAAPGFATYAAQKAAVAALTRTLAVELGPDGIRVNCVAPDIIETDGIRAIEREPGSSLGWSDDATSRLTHRTAIPMGRLGTTEELGSVVLFLASELSSFVTGTTLHPDGGVLASSGWFNWPGSGWANVPPTSVVEHLLREEDTR